MSSVQGSERALAHKYEAVFCIFLVIMAYLGRDNANLIYPNILYLFLLLLSLNFAAILSLRLWPEKKWLAADFQDPDHHADFQRRPLGKNIRV